MVLQNHFKLSSGNTFKNMINLLSIEIAKSRDGESSVFKTRIGW